MRVRTGLGLRLLAQMPSIVKSGCPAKSGESRLRVELEFVVAFTNFV